MDDKNPTNHMSSNFIFEECKANVLIMQDDKRYEEYKGNIKLEYHHGSGWMLLIYISEKKVFSHEVKRAKVKRPTKSQDDGIVWIGKINNWKLKFDDIKQWKVFKMLHKECYKKNVESLHPEITIPGIKFIDELRQNDPHDRFIRPHFKHIQTMENEVERAFNRVVYDMDSEDERWLGQMNIEQAREDGRRHQQINEETFERLMDKLEKKAYLHQQYVEMDLDLLDIASSLLQDRVTHDVNKIICEYWITKRKHKNMPLVSFFRHPSWKPWVQYENTLQLRTPEIALEKRSRKNEQ